MLSPYFLEDLLNIGARFFCAAAAAVDFAAASLDLVVSLGFWASLDLTASAATVLAVLAATAGAALAGAALGSSALAFVDAATYVRSTINFRCSESVDQAWKVAPTNELMSS